MLRLVVRNDLTTIEGRYSADPIIQDQYHELLRKAVGYEVPGAEWSAKYKEGHWDGYISLYNKWKQTVPTGCLRCVTEVFTKDELPYTIVDARKKPVRNLPLTAAFEEHGRSLRWYQSEAAKKAFETTRGVLSLPTGSGKTLTACEMLRLFSCGPAVFIVPAKSLLGQTHKEFEKYLRDEHGNKITIGKIGDSVCQIVPSGVNVITYQTALASFDCVLDQTTGKVKAKPNAGESPQVSKKTTAELTAELEVAADVHDRAVRRWQADNSKPVDAADEKKRYRGGYERCQNAAVRTQKTARDKAQNSYDRRMENLARKEQVRNLFAQCQVMIVDEAHLAVEVIQTLGGFATNAFYRIAITATAFREDGQEIRMQATMGSKIFEITCSDLTDLGFLVPARIFLVKIDHIEESEEYVEVYEKHITKCWPRNYRIKQFAEEFKAAGRPVVIFVERKEHGEILQEMIQDSVFVAGSDKGTDEDIEDDDLSQEERDYRVRMLDDCQANKIILIATSWAYTGVDAPALSTLILAGSGKSAATTYQQIGRVLRPLGKDIEESIDRGKSEAVIIDFNDSQAILHKHSVRRRKVYRGEKSWTVKLIS